MQIQWIKFVASVYSRLDKHRSHIPSNVKWDYSPNISRFFCINYNKQSYLHMEEKPFQSFLLTNDCLGIYRQLYSLLLHSILHICLQLHSISICQVPRIQRLFPASITQRSGAPVLHYTSSRVQYYLLNLHQPTLSSLYHMEPSLIFYVPIEKESTILL